MLCSGISAAQECMLSFQVVSELCVRLLQAPRQDDGMMMPRPPQRGPLFPPHQMPGVPTANGGPMMGPGAPLPPPMPHRSGPMMPPPPSVRGGAIPPMNGGRGGGGGALPMRGGRGGGPMRGGSINAGRSMRTTPY